MGEQQVGRWAADPFGRSELRYHDGNKWTEFVSTGGRPGIDDPVLATSSGGAIKSDTKKDPKRSRWRGLASIPLWGFLLVLGVVLVALVRGQLVHDVSIDNGGVKISFQDSAGGDVTKAEVDQAQGELKSTAAAIEDQARSEAGPAAPTDINVVGTWIGANGLTYVFDQYGDRVTFQEMSLYGITAVGGGVVTGNEVSGQFTAANGTNGAFDLFNEGNVMNGTFTNDYMYGTLPATMYRQG